MVIASYYSSWMSSVEELLGKEPHALLRNPTSIHCHSVASYKRSLIGA
jgi:hypothetical protein